MDIRGRLLLDTSQWRASLQNAGSQLKSLVGMQAGPGGKGGGLGGMLGGAAGMLGMATGAAAVAMALRSAAGEAEELNDAAYKFGGSAVLMGSIKDQAGASGIEFSAVEGSISKLNASLAKARGGSEAMQEAMKTLGLSTSQLEGAPVENWMAVARSLKDAGGDTEKMAAAQVLLGKSAAEMLPFFENADTIGDKTTQGALRFQGALDQLAQAGDNLEEIWGAFVSVVGLAFSPLAFLLNLFIATLKSIGAAAGAILGGEGIKGALLAGAEAMNEQMAAPEREKESKRRQAAAMASGGVVYDEDGNEIHTKKAKKSEAGKLGGMGGALAGASSVGLNLGRNVGAIDSEARAHAEAMERLTGDHVRISAEIAAHTRALKGV